jgi:beta-lactamase regulating signal transducer with metallopeptidase domain
MTLVNRFVSDPWVVTLGWFLLHVVWQGTLVTLALSSLLAVIDQRAARLRYAVSTIALALVLVVPLFTAFAPESVTGTTSFVPTAGNVSGSAVRGAAAVAPVNSLISRTVSQLSASAPWLVPVWLCGVLFLTLRTFAGWWAARALSRTGLLDIPEPVCRRFLLLKRRFGIAREVVFRQSRRAEVPAVIGYLRPVLLLPVSTLSGLTIPQVDAIIAHELAHIRRHDYLVNAFQQLAEILLFFHPAVWWISSQIRREREHCCDDLAVLVCGDVMTYASALLNLEEQRGVAPRLALAATHGSLGERVRRLIGRSELQPGTRTVIVPVLLASVCLSVAVVTAQGVAPTRTATSAASARPRETTPAAAQELITLFDEAIDPKLRQDIVSRLSGNLSPQAWNKLMAIAESDPDLEVRKIAISYIAGRPSLDELSTLYDKADTQEIKLHILSYLHGLNSDAAMAKVRSIARSERDRTVRLKAIDYLSGR